MQELIQNWIGEGVTGLIAALLAWFFSRRQQAATTEMLELDLTDRAITIWRNQSENLWLEVGRIRTDNEKIRLDLDNVTRENETLKKEVYRLIRENKSQKARLKKYDDKQDDHDEHEYGGE